jgi:hypothetical protein
MKNDTLTPLPLETTEEASEREREEQSGSAGVRQPDSLAAARAERHLKRAFQDLSEDEPHEERQGTEHDGPRVAAYTTEQHRGDSGSPVTITGTYTQDEPDPFPPHPILTEATAGEPLPHKQLARSTFLDRNQFGYPMGSPLQTSRQFCENHKIPRRSGHPVDYEPRYTDPYCVQRSMDKTDPRLKPWGAHDSRRVPRNAPNVVRQTYGSQPAAKIFDTVALSILLCTVFFVGKYSYVLRADVSRVFGFWVVCFF